MASRTSLYVAMLDKDEQEENSLSSLEPIVRIGRKGESP